MKSNLYKKYQSFQESYLIKKVSRGQYLANLCNLTKLPVDMIKSKEI